MVWDISIYGIDKLNCDVCLEKNVEYGHEFTDKHILNETLVEYSVNRKKFTSNKHAVMILCDILTSSNTIYNNVESRPFISVPPSVEVTFKFTITNMCQEGLLVSFIHLGHGILKFKMVTSGVGIGCAAQSIEPYKQFNKDVLITFKSDDIGQYEVPIIFVFSKKESKEIICIIRDLVVYVEYYKLGKEKIISPYAQKEVKAKCVYKTILTDHSLKDEYKIPTLHKIVFSSQLQVPEHSPENIKKTEEEIMTIFNTGLTKENYAKFFHHLLWYEETIIRINLKKYNMSAVKVDRIGIDQYELIVPGLSEKRPALMNGDMLFVRIIDDREAMFQAVIMDIIDNTIVIHGLHPEFRNYYDPQAKYDVSFYGSRWTLECMHSAVHNIMSIHQLCRVFPVENKRVRKILPNIKYFNPLIESNPEQRTVVERILIGASGTAPFLLHSPPGTGKTVTIVEAILQLVLNKPGCHIMVCTESNMASDHVASLIIKYIHLFPPRRFLLRASSKFRSWVGIPECLKPYSNGISRSTFRPVHIDEFRSYKIVVTTLSHAAKFAMHNKSRGLSRYITHLLIDEAGQASEPASLVPVSGLLAPRGLLVLAGDPKQLGPVCVSLAAAARGLGLSLMERLATTCSLYNREKKNSDYIVMLRKNFRSDPDILDLPNQLFYDNRLIALAEEDPLSKINVTPKREAKCCRAISFHGVLSKEQQMGMSPSYFNHMEFGVVVEYIQALIHDYNVYQEDIGVVTPYARQVYLINNWLIRNCYNKVEVGTVEAFQGKEKRVIIISTVRANCNFLDDDSKFQLGFLVDDKRFNVAVTRAKAKLIIIGNPVCLQKDHKWRLYIEKCRELGSCYGYQFHDAMLHHQERLRRALVIKKSKKSKKNK